MPEQETTPWGLLVTTADGTIRSTNRRFTAWTGRTQESLLRESRWCDLLTPASRLLFETHFVPRLALQGSVSEVALDLVRPDGTRFPILACALRNQETNVTTITVFDATETRRFETELRASRRDAEAAADALVESNKALHAKHEQLRVTLRSIADAVITTDAGGIVTSMNPTAERIAQVKADDALGAPISALGCLLDARTGDVVSDTKELARRLSDQVSELLLVRQDGSQRHVTGTVGRIIGESGKATGAVYVFQDVTAARSAAVQRAFDASHDPLTKLYNRVEFERRIAHLQESGAHGDRSDILLYIDLDQFKVINDTAGHAAGDQALVAVGQLFKSALRHADVLARLGGDEFGVLLLHCSPGDGARIAEDLRTRLQAMRFPWKNRVYGMTASIGLTTLGHSTRAGAWPLATADMACNAAKEAGRNRVHGFDLDAQSLQHRQDEMAWVSRITRALDEDRFVLHFQPIVRVDGVSEVRRHGELLLRLRDENGAILPPGAFVGAAERYHQMGHIDRWVVRRAFEWLDTVADVSVSINVSGQSLGDASFLPFVVEQLSLHDFAPSRVCIEITETAAIANLDFAIAFMTTLRQRGLLFSLDDFGAGLSSFSYLKNLPVDFVKIDGSFVKTMAADSVNREIVESIHRVARRCDLRTVAEWVEDANVLCELKSIGIDYAQGWHLGRPEPLVEVGTGTSRVARSGHAGR